MLNSRQHIRTKFATWKDTPVSINISRESEGQGNDGQVQKNPDQCFLSSRDIRVQVDLDVGSSLDTSEDKAPVSDQEGQVSHESLLMSHNALY
jgi:hypothetical protein